MYECSGVNDVGVFQSKTGFSMTDTGTLMQARCWIIGSDLQMALGIIYNNPAMFKCKRHEHRTLSKGPCLPLSSAALLFTGSNEKETTRVA